MIDFREKANLIWSVPDLLRGDYKQADYGKVILPMTVLLRLDSVLEPRKQRVLLSFRWFRRCPRQDIRFKCATMRARSDVQGSGKLFMLK